MLTRYHGSLKLKGWALAIAKRSTMRKAKIALASSRYHHARDVAARHRIQAGLAA